MDMLDLSIRMKRHVKSRLIADWWNDEETLKMFLYKSKCTSDEVIPYLTHEQFIHYVRSRCIKMSRSISDDIALNHVAALRLWCSSQQISLVYEDDMEVFEQIVGHRHFDMMLTFMKSLGVSFAEILAHDSYPEDDQLLNDWVARRCTLADALVNRSVYEVYMRLHEDQEHEEIDDATFMHLICDMLIEDITLLLRHKTMTAALVDDVVKHFISVSHIRTLYERGLFFNERQEINMRYALGDTSVTSHPSWGRTSLNVLLTPSVNMFKIAVEDYDDLEMDQYIRDDHDQLFVTQLMYFVRNNDRLMLQFVNACGRESIATLFILQDAMRGINPRIAAIINSRIHQLRHAF